MPTDYIRYDLLTQQALRGVIRTVLEDSIQGLRGEHYFKISFDTTAEGVRIPPRLRAQYPREMTIILQHEFWDLRVSEEAFEVGLSFGGIREHLHVPFEAITGFYDPSVEFGLQFKVMTEDEQAPAADAGLESKPPPFKLAPVPDAADASPPAEAAASKPEEDPDKPTGGGEVVRFDRFRKK
jgi:hypothetical protein